MAKLKDKVTDGLNEVRILILGAQILVGFQYNAIFQRRFDRLPEWLQGMDAVAFCLMLLALGLLIAPAPFHRLAEDGNDTERMHVFTTRMAFLALLPFSACIGLNVYIVSSGAAGLAAACGLAALAFLLWYPVPMMHRRGPSAAPSDRDEPTPLKEKIRTIGTEARIILPGAQALLGFQFSAFLTDAFEKLPDPAKQIHFASLVCISLAVILLMAPAPYHRLAADGEYRDDVDRFSCAVVLGSLVPLAFGLAGDFYLVIGKLLGWSPLAGALPILVLLLLLGTWFAYPLLLRLRAR